MQAKLDEANQRVEWERGNAISNLKLAEKHKKLAAKAKATLSSQTRRVNAGVCIHCNRTFKQLAAHMKCKHSGGQPSEEVRDAEVHLS